ncbi:gliding motility protein GldL [Dysgonomonas sp. ZJ709]|uniref:type IX secretion system motor protein PorL/GldL n=1 Tax=Dysgonomonas sp. ZJ709 TaxID=2709797 RepID=UPI0013EAE180|nr:gliding motility protein GldL [Dysgonomonas sp. ZJ709]
MRKKNNLEAFLSSNAGRRFFNIFYSIGASVVIIGALFKILHFNYANEILMIGMLTEALVFFISAFDNPSSDDDTSVKQQASNVAVNSADNAYLSPEYIDKMSLATKNMDGFAKVMDSLNEVSLSLLASYKQVTDSSQGISANSQGFADNIKSLNQNVLGLNNVYESQFQSINDQIATIKYINESLERIKGLYDGAITDSALFKDETEKMTKQIEALNKVYARLLQAMTANNTPS